MIHLRKISDFEYYYGGTLFDRETKTTIDNDILFNTDQINFNKYEFDFLEVLGCPKVIIYVSWCCDLYSHGYEILWNDTPTNYSKNGIVNVLMTIMKKGIPKKLPFLFDRQTGDIEIHCGRYESQSNHNDYVVSLYDYGFCNKIYAKLKRMYLKNQVIRKLEILNWYQMPIYSFYGLAQHEFGDITINYSKI